MDIAGDVVDVQLEKEGAKNGGLRNTRCNRKPGGLGAIYFLLSIAQEGRDPSFPG